MRDFDTEWVEELKRQTQNHMLYAPLEEECKELEKAYDKILQELSKEKCRGGQWPPALHSRFFPVVSKCALEMKNNSCYHILKEYRTGDGYGIAKAKTKSSGRI